MIEPLETGARSTHSRRWGTSLVELKVAVIVLAVGFAALAQTAASLARMVHHVQLGGKQASGLLAPSGYVFILEDGGPVGVSPATDGFAIDRIAGTGVARTLELSARSQP